MKRAFTLIELLIVIGIIGVLMGVLLSQFGGLQESARTAKCETNLKNLAMAANAVHMAGRYPRAGSTEYSYIQRTGRRAKTYYQEHKGWISWLSQGKFAPTVPTSHQSSTYCSFACDNLDERNYAVTNGAIWTAIGGNRECYVCPVHRKKCQKSGVDPVWSYAMNAKFGYDYSKGGKATDTQGGGIYSLSRAERTLMFAEIPALDPAEGQHARPQVNLPAPVLSGSNGDSKSDSVLQYQDADEWTGAAESIGFNHRAGKRIIGLVAFADGHTERINAPKDGLFNNLTKGLCDGTDITFVNGSYDHYTGAENSDASDN